MTAVGFGILFWMAAMMIAYTCAAHRLTTSSLGRHALKSMRPQPLPTHSPYSSHSRNIRKYLVLPLVLSITAVSAFALMGCAGSEAIKSAPSIEAVTGLNDKLLWIKHNANSGSTYIIELHSDERVGMLRGNISLKDKTVSDVTIVLRGAGENRTIYPTTTGNFIFSVNRGVTLILDKNITVRGLVSNMAGHNATATLRPLIHVGSAGKLVTLDGSVITGNITNSGNGGAVNVFAGGTFHMNGGEISAATCYPGPMSVQASLMGQQMGQNLAASTAKSLNKAVGAKIADPETVQQELKIPVFKGGGVYVSKNGTFIKTGGTIAGYADDPVKGNTVRDHNGTVVHGHGHAVHIGDHAIDSTIGPDAYIRFQNGNLTRGLVSEHPEIQPFKLPPATPAIPDDIQPEQVQPEIVAINITETMPVQTPIIPMQQAQKDSAPQTLSLQPLGNNVAFSADTAIKSNIAVYVTGAQNPAVNRALGIGIHYTFARTKRYSAVEGYETFLAAALAAEEAGSRGAELDSGVVSLAKRAGAEFVCIINMIYALESYSLSARVIDVETGEVKARGVSDSPFKEMSDIWGASVDIVRSMLGTTVAERR